MMFLIVALQALKNTAESPPLFKIVEYLALTHDVNKTFDVLVEGYSKRSRHQLCGRTEQGKMVVFDKGGHHPSETVRVRIISSTAATLIGKIEGEVG